MILKTLTDDVLEARLKKLVRTERKITHLVLQYIGEVDRRNFICKEPTQVFLSFW